MRFTNYKAIKLATPPAGGVNPPTGNIFVWETLDGSDNLVINYRLSDGTDKTFSGGGGLSDAPSDGKTYARKDAGWVEITSSDATSYGNPGGSGNRNSFVIFTTNTNMTQPSYMLDGAFTIGNEWSGSTSGSYLRFQFELAVIINEMKFYQSGSQDNGTWKVQGSNNGTDWSDIGTTFSLSGTTITITSISANTTRYLYYQLLGVSGSLASIYYETEIDFKISR